MYDDELKGAAMGRARQVAVLFADVSAGTEPYEPKGDEAAMAIARCVDQLRQRVPSGGRVVKTTGCGVMAVFTTPEEAAVAANSMQYATDALPPIGAAKLGVRIGFHYGPVIQNDNDIFGGTVNLAVRFAEKAERNQIITSRETSDRLGPVFRSFNRPLYAIHVKGKAEEVELCELMWRQAAEVTMAFTSRTTAKHDLLVLRLKYRDREIFGRRHNDLINVGRSNLDCDLVIANKRASRRHCTFERRENKFVLADQSTNGTYVTPEGATESLLQREELRLGNHGWIAFGQPRAEAEEVVEYFCN